MKNSNISRSGDPYGCHRVIKPLAMFPQPAEILDNNMEKFYENEILVNVKILNIDSASFTQMKKQANNNKKKIEKIILDIVRARGKLHNPVTGSGGMFIGTVAKIGQKLQKKCSLKPGDDIISLVSLTLTPLKIDKISNINLDTGQVKISGRAILFEKSIYVKKDDALSPALCLAVLDVCGAPAQTKKLCKSNDTVIVFGAGGKSGILCCHEAKNRVGPKGRVIGIEYLKEKADDLKALDICHTVLELNAKDPLTCLKAIEKETGNKMADIVINCVNITDTELASVLCCREHGKVYFFSMATSFTKAALCAEGVVKDIDMYIGSGYTKGHAELALNILKKSEKIRKYFMRIYSDIFI